MTHGKNKGRKKHKYIEVRGSARYVIKARTKEEAIELAKQRFEEEAFEDRESFKKANLDGVITGMAGFEANPKPKGTQARKLDLEWKNSKLGSWRHGTDAKSNKVKG